MRSLPRLLIGGGLAILAVIVIAGASWWFFIREDNELATNAPDIPADLVESTVAPGATAAAGDTPEATTTASSSDGAQAFTIISDRSEAAYFADEQLASLPLPSTAKGTTKDITGTFFLTEDGLDLDPAQTSSFTVDLTTIKSDKEMRDSRVQSQGLETGRFPTATFTASRVTGHNPDIAEGEEQTLQLTGTLDLHGVQKEVTWEVKARREGDVITALATLTFLYADFGIAVLNIGGFVSVEDDVTLQVQIVAQSS